jgi:hypothetical protein
MPQPSPAQIAMLECPRRLAQAAAALARDSLEGLCDELVSRPATSTGADDIALIAVRTPRPGQGPGTATAEQR